MNKAPIFARTAGFLVVISGAAAMLLSVWKETEIGIEAGKWAIVVGLVVLLGGKIARDMLLPGERPPDS